MNDLMRINLGAGDDILPADEGWKNYDLMSWKKYDNCEFLDINKLPLPFADNSVCEIRMYHILEHLTVDFDSLFKEFNRILVRDGILDIKVPIYGRCHDHKVSFFDYDYFNGLWKIWKVKPNKEDYHSSSTYKALHFDLVSRTHNAYWSGLWWIVANGYKALERFYSWILSFMYQEWNYVFRNKK